MCRGAPPLVVHSLKENPRPRCSAATHNNSPPASVQRDNQSKSVQPLTRSPISLFFWKSTASERERVGLISCYLVDEQVLFLGLYTSGTILTQSVDAARNVDGATRVDVSQADVDGQRRAGPSGARAGQTINVRNHIKTVQLPQYITTCYVNEMNLPACR